MKLNCLQFSEHFSTTRFESKLLVDIREQEETVLGILPQATILPLSELESRYLELPKNKTLYLYCRSGNRASKMELFLKEKGYTDIIVAVEGGFAELSKLKSFQLESANFRERLVKPTILFERIIDPETSTHSYLVACARTSEAAIVDSVKAQLPVYLKILKEKGLRLKYLLETHIHADHITANSGLLKEHPNATVALCSKSQVKCKFKPLQHLEVLALGNIEIQVLHSPGHTSESVCFLVNGDRLLTGDTLFIDSCGRTDFQAGSAKDMYYSLQMLSSLPPETLVYPAHDYNGRMVTSVGEQLRNNKLLNLSLEDFSAELGSWNLPPPKKLLESVEGNLQCGGDLT